VARERRAGPVSMSADELTAFLGEAPAGAICVTDADGQLLALPACVLGQEGEFLRVEVDGLDGTTGPGTAACVVADRFASYEAIRGVIAQGSILSAEHDLLSKSTVVVSVSRTVTFSFANVKM